MTNLSSHSEIDTLLPQRSSSSKIVDFKSAKRHFLWVLLLVSCVFGLAWKHFHQSNDSKAHASSSVSGNQNPVVDAFLEDSMRFDPDIDKLYTATQFISFTINTMGGSAKHGECEELHVDPETGTCYMGDYNITKDIFQRVAIIERVLNRLKYDQEQTVPKINNDTNVLKIFMMPEFFMRGPHGAYATTQILDEGTTTPGELIEAAARIRDIIVDDYFQDFLFVFGTATYAQVDDDQPEKPWWEYDNLNASEVLYYNFAPIFKGGPDHNHFYVISKKYLSIGDFLQRHQLPDPSAVKIKEYATVGESMVLMDALDQHGITLVDNNLVEIDGIRIGIEICLDHLLGTLWTSLQEKQHSHLVDVHLITSAGMDIEAGPVPIVPGGVAYLSDGEASSAACLRADDGPFDPNKVCRIPPSGRKHIPDGGNGFSTFFTLQSCIDEESVELLSGFYSQYQTQGCANTLSKYGIDVMDHFKFYPPSIEIYPTVDLPKIRDYANEIVS